jgi:phosphatidate phosphatase LPIN
VISDIDGTITKSDVRGQLLPKFGKDWSQLGVASLFAKIAENGYRIAYLSARPIGQATETKEYLKSIIQGDIKLPDGPLLLTPDSLLISLHREVIIKKPEEFKIDCLQTIRKLFPEGMSPLYSGYGNRTNDVFAYTEVGIPKSRIFTINTKGELTHEITPTAHTSYTSDGEIVDHIFPPLSCDDPDNVSSPDAISYSTFTYWREPFEEFDFDEIIEPSSDKN